MSEEDSQVPIWGYRVNLDKRVCSDHPMRRIRSAPGCKNCYAYRLALRLRAMGQPNYRNGFKVTCHPHTLQAPLEWKNGRTIFVNSMSDLFHRDVPIYVSNRSAEVDRRTRQIFVLGTPPWAVACSDLTGIRWVICHFPRYLSETFHAI
jgi:Protein of unknown function (DUF5131)